MVLANLLSASCLTIVDDVSATAGDGLKVTKAITDVNGVYTGVQDVDIITKTSDRIVGNLTGSRM